MIRQELVEEEKRVSKERVNRVLAVYQVLPGPESHELCVYFGMLSRGRIGALLAGLAFMLPGFLLMFALSWFYVTYGLNSTLFQGGLFLQHDAVEVGGWLTNAQFLDGSALSGLLPAPLIIFSTFIGYLGGGPLSVLAITLDIFAPAFAFTMIGHDYIEHLIENTAVHAFLDGITADVVGLIAATALGVLNETFVGIHAWILFSLALLMLFRSKAKWTTAVIILGAGLYRLLFLRGR